MDFKYIRRLKPFIILSMILIFMPVVTKAGGLIPTDFNGFAVTSDGVVVVGDNTAITGFKNGTEVFSFSLPLKTDYALSVNQDNNIVVYAKNARFVFSQDGTPLTITEKGIENLNELKNRKVITTNNGTSYVLTNEFGFVNTIYEVNNGEQSIVYKTPTIDLLVEVAFWEGNLLLIVCFIAGLLDVRKRRFLTKTTEDVEKYDLTETPEPVETEKRELPNDDYTIKQYYQSPTVLSNFNEIGYGYRSLLTMRGTLQISENSNLIKSISLVGGTDLNPTYTPLGFITSNISFDVQLETQSLYGQDNITKSWARVGTLVLNFSIYLTNDAFCNKLLYIMAKDNVNAPDGIATIFKMRVLFKNDIKITQDFRLANATLQQNMGELPVINLTFTL